MHFRLGLLPVSPSPAQSSPYLPAGSSARVKQAMKTCSFAAKGSSFDLQQSTQNLMPLGIVRTTIPEAKNGELLGRDPI